MSVFQRNRPATLARLMNGNVVSPLVAGLVNFLTMFGGATGSPGRVGIQATGTDANVSLVLQPKGTGALIAQLPDNTATGGNARGANAVDWQTVRGAATQAATGAQATIAGGQNNTASAFATAVGGGNANAATSNGAVIAGGTDNTADGGRCWSPGGQFGTARGHAARGFWGANIFGAVGTAQGGEFLLGRSTTDATATRLTADAGAPGAGNTVNLPNSGTYRVRVSVVAQQIAGSAGTAGDCASWDAEVLVKRGAAAANTSIVAAYTLALGAYNGITPGTGFGTNMRDAAAAAWLLTLAADTANGGIAISGTGEANKTIRWVARVLAVEVMA